MVLQSLIGNRKDSDINRSKYSDNKFFLVTGFAFWFLEFAKCNKFLYGSDGNLKHLSRNLHYDKPYFWVFQLKYLTVDLFNFEVAML